MSIRNRIIDFRRIPAGDLAANEKNWRTHPSKQRHAMEAILSEIGYADALLARELPDGRLQLIDGHLRAEVTPDEEVPVLIVDLDDDEARLLLAVHDTIGQMAETDRDLLTQLVKEIDTSDKAIHELFEAATKDAGGSTDWSAGISNESEIEIDPVFHVVVECEDEQDQRHVYEAMTAAGRDCRVLTL